MKPKIHFLTLTTDRQTYARCKQIMADAGVLVVRTTRVILANGQYRLKLTGRLPN